MLKKKYPKSSQKWVTSFLWVMVLFSLHLYLAQPYSESHIWLTFSLNVQNRVDCRTDPHSWACLQLHKCDPWQHFPLVYLGTDLNVNFLLVIIGHSLEQWFGAVNPLTHFASHYYSGWEHKHLSTRTPPWSHTLKGSTNREQQTGCLPTVVTQRDN